MANGVGHAVRVVFVHISMCKAAVEWPPVASILKSDLLNFSKKYGSQLYGRKISHLYEVFEAAAFGNT
jgi:hypothetical protein